MENIESRLQLVEKQMRKSKRLNILLLGGILLATLNGFREKQVLEDLKVNSISIVDDNGKVYAKMARGESGGWLNLFNNSGTSVAGIYTNTDGTGGSWFGNSAGYVRRRIMVDADGGADYIFNKYGKSAITLYNDNNGYGQIKSYDHNEKQLTFIGGSSDGGGGISLSNSNNKFTAYLGGSNGMLKLYDYYGVNKANVYAKNDNGDSFMELANGSGKRIVYIGGNWNDHKGYLQTSDGYNTTGTFPR
ncbi:MAG: hypothetical protein ABIR30_05875 [Chitinophagaceae bacterium]